MFWTKCWKKFFHGYVMLKRFWKILSSALDFWQKNCFLSYFHHKNVEGIKKYHHLTCHSNSFKLVSSAVKEIDPRSIRCKVNIIYVTSMLLFSHFSIIFQNYSIFFFSKEQNGPFLRKQRFNKHLNTNIWVPRVFRRYYFACFGQNFEKKFFHACNAHLIMKTYFLFLVDLMYLCWKFCYFHATVERIKESVQFNHQLLAALDTMLQIAVSGVKEQDWKQFQVTMYFKI